MSEKPEVPIDEIKQRPPVMMAVGYLFARLAIFVLLLSVFWLAGFGGMPGALAAAILSIPISFFMLSGMRIRVAEAMHERREAQGNIREQFRSGGKSEK